MPLSLSAALCLLAALWAGAAHGLDLYVSPSGDDAHPGTADRPLNTLQAARDTLRLWRTAHPDEPATIILLAGHYDLIDPLLLDARDSGTPQAPVIYRAADGQAVVLTGGIELTPDRLELVRDPKVLARLITPPAPGLALYQIDLSALPIAVDLSFEPLGFPRNASQLPDSVPYELFQSGLPLPMSRWPNAGYVKPDRIIDTGSSRSANPQAEERPARLILSEERSGHWRQGLEAGGELWLQGYWHFDWADDRLCVESISPAGELQMEQAHHYGTSGPHTQCAAYNLLEEIDQPGEYAIEPGHQRIYLLAQNPADPAADPLYLSIATLPLIQAQQASHIRFEGLRFEYGRSSAVVAEGGASVELRGCHIRCMGLAGAFLKGTGHRVEDCLIEQVGADGVILSGGDRATLTPGSCEVVDCEIREYARLLKTYHPAVSLRGVGHRVANNHLHHGPHSAILFRGNEHIIERNEIDHVLLETGDCGAIYTGRDWTFHGNIIRHNFIHHLEGTDGRYQNAIYLDDCVSGITVVGNIMYKCHWGMLVGGGRHNTIAGNVFVECGRGIVYGNRGVHWAKSMVAGVLTDRLAAMPVTSLPWSTRYPELGQTLSQEPGRPMGGRINHNLFWNVPTPYDVADPDAVAVTDNKVMTTLLEDWLKIESGRPVFQVQTLQVDTQPKFAPIPLSQIGRGRARGSDPLPSDFGNR